MIRGINSRNLLIIIILIATIQGCSNNTIFTDNVSMPSEIWTLDNVTEFSPEITDTSSISNINFTIRTGTAYPFRNIWLFVNTTSPSGKSIGDTLQYMIADEKGKWYGRGFGDLHELTLPFRTSVYFREKGKYTFSVRHGMRIEDLRGVYDFGIRIEKLKK